MYRLFHCPQEVFHRGVRFMRHLAKDSNDEFLEYASTPFYEDDSYCFLRLYLFIKDSKVINSDFLK